MAQFNKIGVLTSGGDAPGMNAAIRAVTRTAIYHGLGVTGIMYGYSGMINGNFNPMAAGSVSDIIQRGGTILKTARCDEFRTAAGREKAYKNLRNESIDAVIVIGGDGTFRGGKSFNEEYDIPFIGVPGTIDNDIAGTDYTIGYDTAVNTVVQSVDKIRDTATAHDRIFFVEVMGAEAGYIALDAGIASGAEAIIIPEITGEIDQLKQLIERGKIREKSSNIILVAEGDEEGGAFEIAGKFRKFFPQFDVRVTVLGHLQRGGSPSAKDRINASRLGNAAVEALLNGQQNIMAGLMNDEIVFVPFSKAEKKHKDMDKNLIDLAWILSS